VALKIVAADVPGINVQRYLPAATTGFGSTAAPTSITPI
jgi:hypothetical protein